MLSEKHYSLKLQLKQIRKALPTQRVRKSMQMRKNAWQFLVTDK